MSEVAISTWCRLAGEAPEALVARLRALGAPGLFLDVTLDPSYAGALVAELRRTGEPLPIAGLEAPMWRPRGGRPPRLATEDRDERRAALAEARDAVRLAAECQATRLVVKLGRLDLRDDWARTARAFARRELSADAVARLRADRVRLSPRALDLARYALEPLLEAAAARGVTIGLANRARWFEIPDDAEVGVLCEDFRGAPLAPWIDAAAAHARAALGLSAPGEVAAALGARAAGAYLTDACGLRGGLAWGRGEVDTAATVGALAPGALRVVHATGDATEAELAAALATAAAPPA